MVTTFLLALPYTTENFTGVTVSMLYPRHCGDNQKVIALHLSPAIPGREAVDTNDWCIMLSIKQIIKASLIYFQYVFKMIKSI